MLADWAIFEGKERQSHFGWYDYYVRQRGSRALRRHELSEDEREFWRNEYLGTLTGNEPSVRRFALLAEQQAA